MKTCSKCGETKSLAEFARGGAHAWCRPCQREYSRAHYQANKAAYVERAVAWAASNPERQAELNASKSARWRDANRGASRNSSRQWRKANPEKRAACDMAQRARRETRVVAWDEELDALVRQEAHDLKRLRDAATGVEWHVDHIVPLLAETACGLDNAFNLAVVPARFNLSKRHTVLPQQRGFVVEARP